MRVTRKYTIPTYLPHELVQPWLLDVKLDAHNASLDAHCYFPDMAATDKKRKRTTFDTEEPLPLNFNLETLGDDLHDQSDSGEDDEVQDFPGLDVRSDSEDEDEDEGVDDEIDGEDEDEGIDDEVNDEVNDEDVIDEKEDNDSSGEEQLSVFPKPKTVISSITGQPKLVYPVIEPDYDTDSSTEDVRISLKSAFMEPHIRFHRLPIV